MPVILLAAAALPAYALVPLFANQFRARGRIRSAQFPDSILLPGITIVALQAVHDTLGSSFSWLIACHALAVWSVAACYIAMDLRLWRQPRARLPRSELAEIRRSALSITASSATIVFSNRLPVIAVSALLGPAAAALYEGGHRLGQLGTIPGWGANAAVSPMLSEAHAVNARDRLQSLVVQSSWAAFLPSLLLVLIFIVLGRWLLLLFGDAYVDAYGVLIGLSVAAAINASATSNAAVFYMTGQDRVVLAFNLAQFAALAVLVPVLCLTVGVAGAGIAVCLGSVLRDIGMGLMLPSRLGLYAGVWSRQGVRDAIGLAGRALARG